MAETRAGDSSIKPQADESIASLTEITEQSSIIEGATSQDTNLIRRIASTAIAARALAQNGNVIGKVRFKKEGDTFMPEVKIVDEELLIAYDPEYPFDLLVEADPEIYRPSGSTYPEGTISLRRHILAPTDDSSYPQALGQPIQGVSLKGSARLYDSRKSIYAELVVNVSSDTLPTHTGRVVFDFNNGPSAELEKRARYNENTPMDTASTDYYALASGGMDIAESVLQVAEKELFNQAKKSTLE